eukprot:TRINITY_DN9915_c0_g1_i1.p1 TRINITY_DN9915_c0_g1~~TRINITY_DN9915_c0_g1_i1.p1  ORF type:complete len:417 (-),score=117.66 TRINITY_DN9915_c0_g1_i1:487-1737(-)
MEKDTTVAITNSDNAATIVALKQSTNQSQQKKATLPFATSKSIASKVLKKAKLITTSRESSVGRQSTGFQVFEDQGKENTQDLSSDMKGAAMQLKKVTQLSTKSSVGSLKNIPTSLKPVEKRKSEKDENSQKKPRPLNEKPALSHSAARVSVHGKSTQNRNDSFSSEEKNNLLEEKKKMNDRLVELEMQLEQTNKEKQIVAFEKDNMVARLERMLLLQSERSAKLEFVDAENQTLAQKLAQAENTARYLLFINQMHDLTAATPLNVLSNEHEGRSVPQRTPKPKTHSVEVQAVTQDMYITSQLLKEAKDEVATLRFKNELLIQKMSQTQEDLYEEMEQMKRKHEESRKVFSAEADQWKSMFSTAIEEIQKTMDGGIQESLTKISKLEAELEAERSHNRQLQAQLDLLQQHTNEPAL